MPSMSWILGNNGTVIGRRRVASDLSARNFQPYRSNGRDAGTRPHFGASHPVMSSSASKVPRAVILPLGGLPTLTSPNYNIPRGMGAARQQAPLDLNHPL